MATIKPYHIAHYQIVDSNLPRICLRLCMKFGTAGLCRLGADGVHSRQTHMETERDIQTSVQLRI